MTAPDSTYYLYLSPGHWQAVLVEPVQLNATDSYTVTLPEEESLPQYGLTGHPVVNRHGQVVCMMDQGGDCRGLRVTGLDDGTCQVPYFNCENINWDVCEGHKGLGVCINAVTKMPCQVITWPNHYSDSKFQCLHSNAAGCGEIFCPVACAHHATHINCSCYAAWGFCELTGKITTIPDKCMDSSGGNGAVALRCNQGRFLGIVIGTPLGFMVAVGGLVVAVVVIYKFYRRNQYERIN